LKNKVLPKAGSYLKNKVLPKAGSYLLKEYRERDCLGAKVNQFIYLFLSRFLWPCQVADGNISIEFNGDNF